MKTLEMTLWLYGEALKRSWAAVRRNWLVSFAPLAYGIIFSVAVMLVGRLGIVGGLLLGLASQACVSSGLYLIGQILRMGKADLQDFVHGFTVHIWDLITIAFILWIPMRLLAMVLGSVPNGGLIYLLIQLALYVILNPVPEFIYQTRTSGLELIGASYNFIVENWIEWFIPTILFTVGGFFLMSIVGVIVLPLPGILAQLAAAFIFGLALTYAMLFRGFLFAELHGSTRRSRLFRYNARGSE